MLVQPTMNSHLIICNLWDRPYMSTTARAPIWVAKLGLKVVDSTYLGGKIRMYDENEKRYR